MEFKKLFQRKLNLAILLFSVYVLLNCSITQTQQRALQNFGETAVVMSNLTSNELITMRNATIQMNMNRIRLENMSKSKEEMNTNEKKDYEQLDGSFTIPIVSIRLKAITTIRSYAKLLLSLSSDASRRELEQATQSFLFSTQNLTGEYKKFDEKKLNTIGETVKLFGGILTEHKKKDAIQSIILESKDQVELLCDLLAKDFDPKGGKLATYFIVTGKDLQQVADEKLDPTSEIKSEKIKTRALIAFQLAEKNIQKRDTILPEIASAILNFKKANAELQESFRSEVYTTKDIAQFVNTVKAVQDYRAILK